MRDMKRVKGDWAVKRVDKGGTCPQNENSRNKQTNEGVGKKGAITNKNTLTWLRRNR